MTCLEKYLQIHPEEDPREVVDNLCPHWQGLLDFNVDNYCDLPEESIEHGDCEKCWRQPIPGIELVEAQTSIKDSGERTTFATGAVRDMHAGKGRMDLLPWEAIIEVAKHCEEGALKYGEHNVDKGIPIHSLVDSAFRHLAKYTMGMTDEPHLRAAAWNLLWALYMEAKHPELQDIPTRQIWEDKTDSGLLEE